MKKLFSLLMLVPLVALATGCCCASRNQCNTCPPAYGYSSGGCASGTCGQQQPYGAFPSGALPTSYGTASAVTPSTTYATAAAAPTYSSYPSAPAPQTAMAPMQALPTY